MLFNKSRWLRRSDNDESVADRSGTSTTTNRGDEEGTELLSPVRLVAVNNMSSLSPKMQHTTVDRLNSNESTSGVGVGEGSGQIPRNPSRFLVNKVDSGEEAVLNIVDDSSLPVVGNHQNGHGSSPDGSSPDNGLVVEIAGSGGLADPESPPQPSIQSIGQQQQQQHHRGVKFDVGHDIERDATSEHQHTQGNAGTYGTTNFKSFRALQTVEKIPHIDHYRNIMSVEGAMAARPTLAQLHDEEFQGGGGGATNHVEQLGHFERFGMTEGDKNLVSAEYLRPQAAGQKFGWIQGVLLRCILSILGTMLYLRISWVAGVAGIGFGSLIVVVSAIVVTITAISMCAISTNGEIKGGGAYYMISRSLGPEFGGSIGLIFSFANAVAAAMCVVGFAEVLRDMLKNEHGITIVDGAVNDVRIISYATILLILCVVLVGVSFEAKAQLVLLAILALSIVDYVIGTFIPPDEEKKGKGMTGYSMANLHENFYPLWGSQNFFSVFSVFFPACTGIMAGANISGDLADPQKAIPKGTLWAILICMTLYVGAVWTTGMTFLREATGNYTQMMMMSLSDPSNSTMASAMTGSVAYGLLHNYQIMEISGAWRPLVTAGIFAATLSSALAAFVSAPKVFQAVCKDKLFPYITIFGKGYGASDEPRLGYVLAFFISLAIISIGDLNLIAPIISNFFLMSYALVNYACFDASFAGSPGFRPGFRYYNMWVSLFGAIICLAVMFIISWWNALITFGFVTALYVYVLYRKPEVNWGSSTQAHSYKSALQSSLKVAYGDEHVKNYRPQLMVLTGNPVARAALVDFATNITKDSSLLICGDVVRASPSARTLAQIASLSRQIYEWLEKRKVKAFYVPVAHPNLRDGVQCLLQVSGLGKLKPNVLLLGFKNDWKKTAMVDSSNADYFNIIHDAFENNCGVGILRIPGGLDYSDMMSQHNVGDTQKLKLPDPSHLSTFDQAGSGYMNIMDSSRHLSPEAGGNASSSGSALQSTTNMAEKIGDRRDDSTISFAEKLYAAVADSTTNATAGTEGEIDHSEMDREEAERERERVQLDEERQQKEEKEEMLKLLHEGSVQSESTGQSPDLGADLSSTPASPQANQTASKAARTRHMSKKQKEVMDIINQFQIRVKKPVLHVYWLFDDGGLGLLLPHLLTLPRSYLEGAKLTVFTVAASRSQLEREQRSMAALLSRFRIDYSDVLVIPDLAKKPQKETIQGFEEFIAPFRAPPEEPSANVTTTEDGNEAGSGAGGGGSSPNNSARGLISESEYIALRAKTYRQLRIRELLLLHSSKATLTVCTLPVPRRGILGPSLYLAWLDFISKDLPPVLFLRGNQQSVLTFYS